MADVELPIGDTLSRTFDLFGENAGKLVPTAAIVWAVPALVGALVTQAGSVSAALFGSLVNLVISVIAGALLTGALVHAVTEAATGGEMEGPAELLDGAKRYIAPLIVVSILTGLAVLGGLILLIIPGIIFAIWFSLAPAVVVNEDLTGTTAMKRSKQIVQGNGFRLFLLFLVFGIIVAIAGAILGGILGAILPGTFLSNLVSTLVVQSIVSPLQATALVLVYLTLTGQATTAGGAVQAAPAAPASYGVPQATTDQPAAATPPAAAPDMPSAPGFGSTDEDTTPPPAPPYQGPITPG
jgi:hypothetical protein